VAAESERPVPLSQAREKLLARLRHRKTREREGLFLVEGIRAATEALLSSAEVVFAVVSPRLEALAEGSQTRRSLEARGREIHLVDDSQMESLSGTESPQGIILVCRDPQTELGSLAPRSAKPGRSAGLRLLLLDGVQDPGNAGTLLRTATAFGLDAVIALDGTVDLYNAKVVRGSAGAIFRTAVIRAPWETVRPWLDAHRIRVLVADPSGEDVGRVVPGPPWALAIGSEGAGVRAEVRAAGALALQVPMPGGTESLNAAVAGSILLYVLTRGGPLG
jgi:RNA methyltransferase, TrmH family